MSNSKNHGQPFLAHAKNHIRNLFGDDVGKIVFVPYAGVTVPFDPYAELVKKHFGQMGYQVESVHQSKEQERAIADAGAIIVGGGNTFHLLHYLYENDLVAAIKQRVSEGAPYLGWSAGSNVACPTIMTTNDMPIVRPRSFAAFDLVPFQINPHYLDQHPAGHGGETREQRLLEYIEVNPDVFVLGLREGTMLRVEGKSIELVGDKAVRVFRRGTDPVEYAPGPLDFLENA
jgi:dipeptidase E